jgi:hypothetical protein
MATNVDSHLVETADGPPEAGRHLRTTVKTAVQTTVQTALTCLIAAWFVAPGIVSAQTTQADPRWHAWIGCWSSSQNGLTGAAARVCVVPTAGSSAVDIVTVANARVVSREHVEANGERRASQRDGCTGWETARWSGDGRRVYVQSEHQCAAGAKRTSDGLITISPQGDWLDVVSVTMGTNTGVRVLRHRPTVEPTDLPADIAATLHTVPSPRVRDARTAAVAPLAIADVVDASHQVSAGVVAAWLNDVRQDFSVDAKRLVELADAKVPDRVIDMIVALAYPDAFAVPPSPTAVGALAVNEPGGSRGGGFGGFGGIETFDSMNCGNDFSVFGFGGCSSYSQFGYSPFGYMSYGYLPYSYSRYGYGPFGDFGGGYGGWYETAPIVIVRPPGDSNGHGQVVNGRGYTSGTSGTATATSSGSGNSSSGSSGSSSGSSGGSSGGSVGPASSGGGGGDRTAHPR